MPKFIIDLDSSRINSNGEYLPFQQFVPGVLSLKNTNKPYTLYIGELNKSPLSNTIDIFKNNIEIYKKILSMLPKATEIPVNNTIIFNKPSNLPSVISNKPIRPPITYNFNTAQIKPYVFSSINPKFTPPNFTTNFLNQVRQRAINNSNIGFNILSDTGSSGGPIRTPVRRLLPFK